MRATGAVWVGTPGLSVVRVAEGGKVLQRAELAKNRAPLALMLGGPDRRTLFICTVEWRQADGHVAHLDRLANGPRTGDPDPPGRGARHGPACDSKPGRRYRVLRPRRPAQLHVTLC